MTDRPKVLAVNFHPVGAESRASGLLGFVSFRLADIVLVDGVAVRRSLDGRIVLVFPERTDRNGVQHPYVRPLDRAARDSITEQVVARLRGLGVLP